MIINENEEDFSRATDQPNLTHQKGDDKYSLVSFKPYNIMTDHTVKDEKKAPKVDNPFQVSSTNKKVNETSVFADKLIRKEDD